MRALIVGGTGAIGQALLETLEEEGWDVTALGSRELDLRDERCINSWCVARRDVYDLVVIMAGRLYPQDWALKSAEEYRASYMLHAAGPVVLLAEMQRTDLLKWWSKVVLVSTVGATNAGAVDLGYGMAKAALEKAHRAFNEHASWRCYLVRLDLVDTPMIRQLPVDTLHGRPVMSPQEAAELVMREAGLLENAALSE